MQPDGFSFACVLSTSVQADQSFDTCTSQHSVNTHLCFLNCNLQTFRLNTFMAKVFVLFPLYLPNVHQQSNI